MLALAIAMLSTAVQLRAETTDAWRTWLERVAFVESQPQVTFPSAAELSRLRQNRAWIERWAEQTPSIAWHDVAGELIVKYQQTPLRAARVFAYVHTAIHDALVHCARRGCDAAMQPIAMHAAASRMLDYLYPDESRGRLESLGHSAAAAVLSAKGSNAHSTIAWQTGRAVAETFIRRALDDGWDLPKLTQHRPDWKPGGWRASPPLNIYDPLEPNAGQWRTWVLKSAAEVEPPPPLPYGSSAYWAEVDEVRAVAGKLTTEQKRIAEEWNLGVGSVTPPGVWNIHAKKLVLERKLDAAQAARVFSTLNAAIADAMIACWQAKYKWWTERPVTVIREHRDPKFTPHLVTPAFPSYVSGHSSASGAAATVLAAFFPEEAAKLHGMAEEAAMSRLYGGIHFRSDNEAGLALGRAVANRALARQNLVDRLS